MGQEQSNNHGTGPSTSQQSGVSSSFSFLAKKRNSVREKTSQIVVVKSTGAPIGDPNNDDDLKKIKEVARFFPILKGVLPAFRDSPDILTKVEPKYIYRFLHRLQYHFGFCSQTVSSEQSSICTQIIEVDQLIKVLLNRMSQTGKKYDYFVGEMKKAEQLSQQLDSIQTLLHEIVPSLASLNELLPLNERLPPLELPVQCNKKSKESDEAGSSALKIEPVPEFSVIDKR
ncbi:tumor suppressor protein [Ditylenchus destructor]|nr:tumor suppressor protein [Ditylenchus destructor]